METSCSHGSSNTAGNRDTKLRSFLCPILHLSNRLYCSSSSTYHVYATAHPLLQLCTLCYAVLRRYKVPFYTAFHFILQFSRLYLVDCWVVSDRFHVVGKHTHKAVTPYPSCVITKQSMLHKFPKSPWLDINCNAPKRSENPTWRRGNSRGYCS